MQRLCPDEDVIYNDIGVCILVNQDTIRLSKLLPGAINVMNKGNEHYRPIHRAKRHDVLGPLGGVGSGKG
jgi:hypothetical protein